MAPNSTQSAVATAATKRLFIAQVAIGDSIGQTDLATAFYAVPGTLIGLAIVYYAGLRGERELARSG